MTIPSLMNSLDAQTPLESHKAAHTISNRSSTGPVPYSGSISQSVAKVHEPIFAGRLPRTATDRQSPGSIRHPMLAVRVFAQRSARTLALLLFILVISAIDLYLTSTHASGAGMAEANPLARLIIATGSPAMLAAWKLLSLIPITILLVRYRHHIAAEMTGWIALGLLLIVTYHWIEYTTHITIIHDHTPALEMYANHQWVTMGSAR